MNRILKIWVALIDKNFLVALIGKLYFVFCYLFFQTNQIFNLEKEGFGAWLNLRSRYYDIDFIIYIHWIYVHTMILKCQASHHMHVRFKIFYSNHSIIYNNIFEYMKYMYIHIKKISYVFNIGNTLKLILSIIVNK